MTKAGRQEMREKMLELIGEKEEMGNNLDFNTAYPRQIRNQFRDELTLKVKKIK